MFDGTYKDCLIIQTAQRGAKHESQNNLDTLRKFMTQETRQKLYCSTGSEIRFLTSRKEISTKPQAV